MKLSREKRLERAQLKVLFNVEFFAAGVCKLPVIFTDKVPTAATNGKCIYWNADWFDSLPDAVLPTVLCHEVWHCMAGHIWRAPVGADHEMWNHAIDHATNLSLKEFSKTVMAKNLADPFPFPEPHDAYLADPQYAGLAEEVIYSKIMNQPKGPGKGPGGKGGQGQGVPGRQPFGEVIMQKPNAQGGQQSAAEQKALANDWQGELANAVKIAQGRGNCPGDIARLADEMINPKLPWQTILRSLLREQCSDDWDFQHPAMEYSASGFIMPSMRSEKMGTVVFCTDTSGSISGTLLSEFQSEKQACLDDLQPRKLVDIYCDAAVNEAREYSPGDIIDRRVKGGGGTSFIPAIEFCEKMDEPPKALVYLTDLDGSFPDHAPAFPVIWCAYGTKQQAPFGETLNVE